MLSGADGHPRCSPRQTVLTLSASPLCAADRLPLHLAVRHERILSLTSTASTPFDGWPLKNVGLDFSLGGSLRAVL